MLSARVAIVAVVLVLLAPLQVVAQTSSSANYQVDQTFFGSGGELNACSSGPSAYCSKQTIGELGIGEASSPNYRVYAGFNTTDAPYLEFVVTASNIDLGYLKTAAVSTATGTFYIRAWQASGYVVRTEASPPTNTGLSAHQLTPLVTPAASSPGTEQFGINLVKNANFCGSGCDLGADPQQSPNASFSFGTAVSGYNTPGLFKYQKGDIIAQSLSSTSVTIYTISYIFNVSNVSPAGQYDFNHVLVATATY